MLIASPLHAVRGIPVTFPWRIFRRISAGSSELQETGSSSLVLRVPRTSICLSDMQRDSRSEGPKGVSRLTITRANTIPDPLGNKTFWPSSPPYLRVQTISTAHGLRLDLVFELWSLLVDASLGFDTRQCVSVRLNRSCSSAWSGTCLACCCLGY